jgi:D-alanyl-D-alanine endopeptidase (penicillin-binding protein 7)
MNARVRALGLKNTRFFEPTGLSPNNVSTPRETIKMLRAVVEHPLLRPITERVEYDAHPVGKPPIKYVNTDHAASRGTIQVLAGKTGYNDVARYCLVVATRIDGRVYFMSFLSNEGKLTRFGDVARVADWIVAHKPKGASGTLLASARSPAAPPVGVAAPTPEAARAASVAAAPAPVAAPAEPAAAAVPAAPAEPAAPAAPAAPVAGAGDAGAPGAATPVAP